MFGFALVLAGVSLFAFLVVLLLGVRFFGALAGESGGNELQADTSDIRSAPAPKFKRFDLGIPRTPRR